MHGILYGGKEEKGNVETTFIKNEIICSLQVFLYKTVKSTKSKVYYWLYSSNISVLWIASVWMKGIMLHVCAYKYDIL